MKFTPGCTNTTKLSEVDVRTIFSLAHDSPLPLRTIAKIFDIHWTTVWDIRTRRTWKHLWSEEPRKDERI